MGLLKLKLGNRALSVVKEFDLVGDLKALLGNILGNPMSWVYILMLGWTAWVLVKNNDRLSDDLRGPFLIMAFFVGASWVFQYLENWYYDMLEEWGTRVRVREQRLEEWKESRYDEIGSF